MFERIAESGEPYRTPAVTRKGGLKAPLKKRVVERLVR